MSALGQGDPVQARAWRSAALLQNLKKLRRVLHASSAPKDKLSHVVAVIIPCLTARGVPVKTGDNAAQGGIASCLACWDIIKPLINEPGLRECNASTRETAWRKTSASGEAEHAPLAQLVEQLTLNQWVAGSSPAGGTW
jgi:hypothetical protein